MREVNGPPGDPVSAMLHAWQMPMILYCDWLKLAATSFDHRCGPRHSAGGEEDEGQLVVPDPIEIEGEHALFA